MLNFSLEAGDVWNYFDDDYDSYYVIKIKDGIEDKYFFSPRTFVKSVGLAKKFNTQRSARRSMKMLNDMKCKIEKIRRNNF